MLRTIDRWRGPSRGSVEQAMRVFVAWGSFPIAAILIFVTEVYRLCKLVNLDASLLIAHAALETGKVGIGRGFLSDKWATVDNPNSTKNRFNPAGMGITPNYDFGYRFSPLTAAQAFVVHHARYEIPASDTAAWAILAPYIKLDPRFNAVPEEWRDVVTVQDMDGKWWTNPKGAEDLVARGNQIFPNASDQFPDPVWVPEADPETGSQEPTMPTYTTTIPGLPGGPLVTEYPINIKLIPVGHTYQRPGIKAAKPRRSVQHGTGNPNSMAASEIAWLVDSQAGGGQVSFHATSDDLGVWVGVPADEVTWQAADGGGPGNMNGFSCEMIENSTMWANATRRARAIFVTADFMGKVAARLDISVPEQHWTFNYALPPSQRHDCPNKLRYVAGAWDAYVKQWSASKIAEKARMAGGGAIDPITPPKTGDTFVVTDSLNLRKDATTTAEVITVLDAGTTGTVTGNPKEGSGYTWYPVKIASGTSNGKTGWVVQDWIAKTGTTPGTTTPAPKPTYADPLPIPALLGTDISKNDTAEGIVADGGTDFVFVSDVIEVIADSLKRMQRTGDPSVTVGPDYKKGDRFVGAWLYKVTDGELEGCRVYVTPAPEWARVLYMDADGKTYTKRVADAPLALAGSVAAESAVTVK